MMFRNQCCYKMKKATIAKKQTKTNIYIYIFFLYTGARGISKTLYYLSFQSFDLNTFDLNPKWGVELYKYHMKNSSPGL